MKEPISIRTENHRILTNSGQSSNERFGLYKIKTANKRMIFQTQPCEQEEKGICSTQQVNNET